MLDRRTLSILPLLSLVLLLAVPASAQEVLVHNAATARVSNGVVWDLQSATMRFGDAGATAHLREQTAGRVTGGLLKGTRNLDAPSSVDVAGLGAVITTDANLGEVTVTRGHTVQTASNGNESIARYYDISPSASNSSLGATLTLNYAGAEVPDGFSESNLELFKRTSGTWEARGVDDRDPSANTVTRNGVDSFSRWTLGSSTSPLPVELASFDGNHTEDGIRLTWQTASETGNTGFSVQRKVEGQGPPDQWTNVGFVDGSSTSSSVRRYRFTDTDLPYAADTLAYRLRQVDADGSANVTDPVLVARTGVKRMELRETFPNPAHNQVTVRYAVPDEADAANVTMRLYDVLGRRVHRVVGEAEAGRHERQLQVQALSSGVYFLRLTANGETQTQRLTIVR